MERLFLFIGLIAAQVMDVISTHIAINKHNFSEVNPIGRALIDSYGMEGVTIIKVAIAIGCIILYEYTKRSWGSLHKPVSMSLHIGHIGTWVVVFLNMTAIIWAAALQHSHYSL